MFLLRTADSGYFLSVRFRGYTFALRPTPEQAERMAQTAGVCRLVWNLALEQRRDHWRRYQARTGDNLNHTTQCRELTLLRAEFDFIRAVHVTPQQRVLKALDEAFRKAWAGLGGYPQPKRKGVDEAFSHHGREIAVEKISARWGRVRVPKIGWVRFRRSRDIEGDLREATFSLTALGWQVSFGCLLEGDRPDPGGAVGIDRGVAVALMLSDGTYYTVPDSLAAMERRIASAQRVVSRRARGSNRRRKAVQRVARLRAKQARIRKHWAHRATTEIASRYGTVIVERLRTKDMTKRHRLGGAARKRGRNRAILNVGWHQIEAMLAYKAARLVKVDPSYSSQTCASCGTVDRRSRESQTVFACVACGQRDNADRNAAVVILNRGNTPGVEAAGRGAVEARTLQAVNSLGIPRLQAGEDVKHPPPAQPVQTRSRQRSAAPPSPAPPAHSAPASPQRTAHPSARSSRPASHPVAVPRTRTG
jgi:putative transposase